MIRLPSPMDHQREWLLSNARFKVLCAGRRSGKSQTGEIAAIDGHGPTRGHFPGALQGARIAWMAPTTPQARREVWPQLKARLRGAWSDKSEIDRSIRLPTGGSIWVLSADAIANVGGGFDGVVLDEFALMKSEIWERDLRPTLMDRGGWAIFPSTPRGIGTYYHRLFVDGGSGGLESPRKAAWRSWQTPSEANTYIPREEIEAAREDAGPLLAAQEYDAAFVSDAVAVFQRPRVRHWGELPDRFDSQIVTVDAAFKDEDTSDFVVIQVWGIHGVTRYLIHQERSRLDIVTTIERLEAVVERYPDASPRYIEDKANGPAIIRLLRDRISSVLPVSPGKDSKISRARSVQSLWEAGNVLIPPESTPWVQGFVDRVTAFPNVAHDDEVDAMVYALLKLKEGRSSRGKREEPTPGKLYRVSQEGW